jgi:Domain of unknown function (DUF4388)
MDEQLSSIDEEFGQPAADASESEAGTVLVPGAMLSDTTIEGKEPSMNQHESSEEAPAASLVGSLAAFSLSDILSMLASTKQTGELQVVSEATDGKVWLADGELSNANVGAAATIGQAVFELACISEGWFYFTVGVVSSSGQPTVPVLAVLNEVRPQVDEWREIRRDVPLEAVVKLAPNPPGQDVQIRNDQWRVLTTVGTTGHSVRAVIEQIGGDQIVGLRTLRDLHAAGLIELDCGSSDQVSRDSELAFRSPVDYGAEVTLVPDPPTFTHAAIDDVQTLPTSPPPSDEDPAADDGHQDDLAEVAIMPPPIADDPWAPSPETTSASDNGVA